MVISFITEQGGVGKTSLCFNLAWHLASQGKKVLMVDTDAQGGNLSYVAGIVGLENMSGLNEIISKEEKIKDCIYRISPNLSIISANNSAMFLAENIKKTANPNCIKEEFAKIKKDYDFIFIDTSPTPSIIHITSLIASDYMIIPLMQDAKSIESTKHILETFENVKAGPNKKLEIMALVYNKYGRGSGLGKFVETKIRELCGTKGLPIAQTKIPQNVSIAETMVSKEGITIYNPKSKGAVAYKELSKELFGI